MTWLRAIAFWTLFACSLAASAWWTLRIPRCRWQPERLLPPQATVVLRQDQLAAALPAALANPLVAGGLVAAGVDSNLVQRWPADPALRELLARFAPGESALAYVPVLGAGQSPAILLVSWLGGRSQRMRWMLKSGRVPGAALLFHRNGHLVWQLPAQGLPPGQSLTVSATEGMAVLCVSRDRAALIEVLDSYDLTHPRAPDDAPAAAAAPVFRAEYRAAGIWTPPGARWQVDVGRLDEKTLSVTCRGPWPADWPLEKPGAARAGAWDVAAGAAVLRVSVDRELAQRAGTALWQDFPSLAGELLCHESAGPLAISVVDGAFAGRALGMKLPTILFGLPVPTEAATRARLDQLLDQMNRRYRWGLVRNEQGAGAFRPSAIEGTSETAYSRFALNEQVAWLVTNRTFVLASNTEGFTNLLLQAVSSPSRPASPAALDAWIDLSAGGKSLRLLLTAWSVRLDEREVVRTALVRGRIRQAKAWVDALAPLRSARIIADRAGDRMVIRMVAGDAA